MTINKKKHFIILALMVVFGFAQTSQAQSVYKLEFKTQNNAELRKATYGALKEQVDYFHDKYGTSFHLYYAFDDLNRDGKDEIFVQLNEQYEFRDKQGNVDTFVFAQTSRGLLQVLHTQAIEIGIGLPDDTRLKQIYAHKAPNVNRPVAYGWNGKDEYIKK